MTITSAFRPEWGLHSRNLRSALDIANDAARQIAELALNLEVKYDADIQLPANLALVYDCVASHDAVKARAVLDYGDTCDETTMQRGIWWQFNRSAEWDRTVGCTVALLRGDDVSNLVCNTLLAHYMSQAALAECGTPTPGGAE